MSQDDHYEIDGHKDASGYYWTGAKGERRAYSKAYADARLKRWNDDRDYMKNVAKGGEDYDQARMKDEADSAMSKKYRKSRAGRKRGTAMKVSGGVRAPKVSLAKGRRKEQRKP